MAIWYENSLARILVDNHITEDDPQAMRRFDPANYAAMMKKAGVDASMVYAVCHNGNCYYPTKVGHMHKNLEGRDIFGETVQELRKQGVTPIAYVTIIFHNDSAKTHPEWRQYDPVGRQQNNRYWFSCTNHPGYRQFCKDQLAEVVSYPVEGIFIDMTFWSTICHCESCRNLWLKETGKELPAVIDWNNPEWVQFQRARERWMGECAMDLTQDIRKRRPDMSIVHQFSPMLVGYHCGQTAAIAAASDYASGDFYGDKNHHRMGLKVMTAFSPNMPTEFMTSRCVNLHDHTSMKSEAELTCSAATSLAFGGAYFFIDAINVDGTLCNAVYERLNRVSKNVRPFLEKVNELKPAPVADTGLYYSTASNVNEAVNGMKLRDLVTSATHMGPTNEIPTRMEVLGASMALNRANIPYKAVVDVTTDYGGMKNLVMNNILFMSKAEVDRVRQFVRDGGTLIATGMTSYYDIDGETTGDFALADVFGVSYTGKRSNSVNYLATGPLDVSLQCNRPGPLVKATTAKVLGKVAEPMFPAHDKEKYTSIHSNPPSVLTEYAGLTINEYGKGKCIYLYSSVMSMTQDAQQNFAANLLREYIPSSIVLDTNAPEAVEITLLKSTKKEAWLLCFVNYQKELPNIPVHNLKATIQLPGGAVPKSCKPVSGQQGIGFKADGGKISVEVPVLDTIEMLELE